MNTTIFSDAVTVRRFLREHGFTRKVTIRLMRNPFGGMDRYAVWPKDLPSDISLAVKTVGSGPSRWYDDHGGKLAAVMNELARVLADTNASAARIR